MKTEDIILMTQRETNTMNQCMCLKVEEEEVFKCIEEDLVEEIEEEEAMMRK